MERGGLATVLDGLERRGLPEALREEVEALLRGAEAPGRPTDADAWPPIDTGRYTLGALVGEGSMGRVYAVQDRLLGRALAWKEPRTADAQARLRLEAAITAWLAHPGVIPVFEVGIWPGRGAGYLMRLLDRHEPLGAVMEGLHRQSGPLEHAAFAIPGAAGAAWSLRRVLEALRTVADTLAHAHARGVVHRDVKPDNIMVGGFDEVVLMDWGLVKALDGAADGKEAPAPGTATRAGAAPGSPLFMAPERWRGAAPEPSWDVFALGVTLLVALVGRLSERGGTEALEEGLDRLRARGGPLAELEELVRAATAARPADRPPAAECGVALVAWLDGSARRARAERAWSALPELDAALAAARAEEERLTLAHAALCEAQPSWAGPAEKEARFSLEAQRARAAHAVQDARARRLSAIQATLALDPRHAGAAAALDAHLIGLHQKAERSGDRAELGVIERLYHDNQALQAWRAAPARLSLCTDPPEVAVRLRRAAVANGRLRFGAPTLLGRTPLEGVELAAGSVLLELDPPGCAPVSLPMLLRRGEHHAEHGLDRPLRLPPPGAVDPQHEVWVPPGAFLAGGEGAFAGPRTERWVGGFAIRRLPVSNAEYLAFLNALRRDRRGGEAREHQPKLFSFNPRQPAQPIYGFDAERGYFLDPKRAPGWELNHPVVYVSWYGAVAYAAWWGERTGLPWRLPFELEREKAGRGVDGRRYPWGDEFDHSFTCVQGSRAPGLDDAPVTLDTEAFPADLSPYGVRFLAGNTVDWCLDPWRLDGPFDPRGDWRALVAAEAVERAFRGGHWYSEPRTLAQRGGFQARSRVPTTGIRLVRSLSMEDP